MVSEYERYFKKGKMPTKDGDLEFYQEIIDSQYSEEKIETGTLTNQSVEVTPDGIIGLPTMLKKRLFNFD